MEERYFDNGPHSKDIPLITMVGASNEQPEDTSVAAMFDRFHFRFWVDYVSDDNIADILLGNTSLTASIDPDLLQTYQLLVDDVTVPDQIIKKLISVRRELRGVGIPISDRRLKQVVRRAMAASAVLHERTEITEDDAFLLPNLLSETEADLRKVTDVVFSRFSCSAIEAERLLDGMFSAMDDFYDVAQKDPKAVSIDMVGHLLDIGKKTLKKLDKLDKSKAAALKKRLRGLSQFAQKLAGLSSFSDDLSPEAARQ